MSRGKASSRWASETGHARAEAMIGYQRAAVVAASAVMVCVVACGGASSSPAASAQPKAAASTSDVGELVAKGAAERNKSSDAAAATKKTEGSGDVPEWTSSTGFDPKEWMKAHHVTGQVGREANCEAAQLGSPTVDAMSCDERYELQLVRGPVQTNPDEPPEVIPPVVTFRRVLYVPAGGGLRKALDIPIEAGPINPVTKDPDANAFARLHVELDSAGTRLSVTDDPNFSCERAHAKQVELASDKDTAETAKWLKKAVDPVCASRGEYTWRNGSFQRVKPKR